LSLLTVLTLAYHISEEGNTFGKFLSMVFETKTYNILKEYLQSEIPNIELEKYPNT